jgi:transposase
VAITPEQRAQILRYFHVERWQVGTIARQLGLHHVTVDRALSEAGLPKAERQHRACLIDPFVPFILETLKQYPTLTASRVYEMVRVRGYSGGPDHFRHQLAHYRPRPPVEAYHRLKTLPGEQAQTDWGLCRARHRPHYAEARTMPGCCTRMSVFRPGQGKRPPMGADYSA